MSSTACCTKKCNNGLDLSRVVVLYLVWGWRNGQHDRSRFLHPSKKSKKKNLKNASCPVPNTSSATVTVSHPLSWLSWYQIINSLQIIILRCYVVCSVSTILHRPIFSVLCHTLESLTFKTFSQLFSGLKFNYTLLYKRFKSSIT